MPPQRIIVSIAYGYGRKENDSNVRIWFGMYGINYTKEILGFVYVEYINIIRRDT